MGSEVFLTEQVFGHANSRVVDSSTVGRSIPAVLVITATNPRIGCIENPTMRRGHLGRASGRHLWTGLHDFHLPHLYLGVSSVLCPLMAVLWIPGMGRWRLPVEVGLVDGETSLCLKGILPVVAVLLSDRLSESGLEERTGRIEGFISGLGGLGLARGKDYDRYEITRVASRETGRRFDVKL